MFYTRLEVFNVVLKNFDILGQVNLPELQSGDELPVSKYVKCIVNNSALFIGQ